jgi:hypothetical protein
MTGVDIGLVILFLIGLYTHYTIQITATVPFPAAISGLSGMALLWRRRADISSSAFVGLLIVVLMYVLSILSATDISFLGRRFHGLIQLVYSLVISYTLFLTLVGGTREQIARLFIGFALVILIGCLLEKYGGLAPISDAVRHRIYSSGVYDSDVRDEMLYGHVRPKFFASEPSIVSLCFTIFTFVWFGVSTWRWKLPAYLALIGAGVVVMSGPTLLLMLLLLVPYQLSIAAPKTGSRLLHVAKVMIVCAVLGGSFVVAANTIFTKRVEEVTSGSDPSFFYRVLGPMIATRTVIGKYPIAGAGLTGEPFVEDEITTAYIGSPAYSRAWKIVHPASELLVNYFWLHWIYLGLVWGTVIVAAISFWLRAIGVRQVIFCWMVWSILGQASGAYVGPMTWSIFFLAAMVALVADRSRAAEALSPSVPVSVAHGPDWRWNGMPPRLARR